MKNFIQALLVCTTISISAFVIPGQKPKIDGTWNLTVQTSMGNGTPVVVLKQENDTLITGSYSGQLGEAPLKGTVNANEVKFHFIISGNTIEYAGIVEGNDMKGKVTLGSMGEGTFTGKRKEPLK